MNTRRTFLKQKWFFVNGPADGAQWLKQNIELAHALREELGPQALLMFDGIQSEILCPMLEYLVRSRVSFQRCQTRPLVAQAGLFAIAEESGLGPTLDLARLEVEPANG